MQTTRALLCLGAWSKLGFVRPKDAKKIAAMEDLEDPGSDYEMEAGWDHIDVSTLDAE